MTTPFSVLTNLAYIAAGVYVLRGQLSPIFHFRRGKVWQERARSLSSWLVGLSFVALGIASGWFHWFYDPITGATSVQAQLADERGMYIAFSVLAGVLWAVVYRRSPHRLPNPPKSISVADIESRASRITGFGFVLGVTLAALASQPWADSMYVMPALALLCIGAVGVGQSWRRALAFFIAFLGIVLIRELPEANFWPRDLLWGYDPIHGFWHLWTGYVMWKLYESTHTPPKL